MERHSSNSSSRNTRVTNRDEFKGYQVGKWHTCSFFRNCGNGKGMVLMENGVETMSVTRTRAIDFFCICQRRSGPRSKGIGRISIDQVKQRIKSCLLKSIVSMLDL